MGWHRALQSAKHFDTWVICEEHEFAGEIRRYTAAHGDVPGLHFVFVPIDQREWSWGQIHDSIWYAVCAAGIAGPSERRSGCTSGSASTWCIRSLSAATASRAFVALGAPFLWGPIGGTQNYPWRFLAAAGFRGAVHEFPRSVVNRLQLRLSSRVRGASRRAAAILAANSTVQRDVATAHGVHAATCCWRRG